MRLSEHFLLLDFLYDQSTTDCVVHCSDLVSDRVESLKEDSEEIAEGRYLCDTILERIVGEHGPISIAAGLWFSDLPGLGLSGLRVCLSGLSIRWQQVQIRQCRVGQIESKSGQHGVSSPTSGGLEAQTLHPFAWIGAEARLGLRQSVAPSRSDLDRKSNT